MLHFVILFLTIFLGTAEESKAASRDVDANTEVFDADLRALAQRFFPQLMREESRERLLRTINDVPKERRERVLNHLRHADLMPDTPELYDALRGLGMISAFGDISEERDMLDVLSWFRHQDFLTNDTMDDYDIWSIIKNLHKIPISQRGYILERIETMMDSLDKAYAISVFSRILPEQIESVIKVAQEFFPNVNGVDKFSIIDASREIDDETDRADVLKWVQHLFTRVEHEAWRNEGWDEACIIRAIHKIPAGQQRQNVVALALGLFTPTMEWVERAQIIEAVHNIPTDPEYVCSKALQKFQDDEIRKEMCGSEGYVMVKLIQDQVKLSKAARNNFGYDLGALHKRT